MNIVNLTPHVIRLNDGREFEPSGIVARVSSSYTTFIDDVAHVVFGEITGLPAPEDGTLYVASGMVAAAAQRTDVVSPATGHPECRRENGNVISVPGFIRS